MRIMFSIDNYNAHYYISLGLARAFTAAGHECVMWDINKKNKYDAFDDFKPDIFFGQTYNLDDGLARIIEENPAMRVVMKAGDWPLSKYEHNFPVLVSSKKEREKLKNLLDKTRRPDILFVHHHPKYLSDTHGGWQNAGFNVISLLNAGDYFDFYNAKFDARLECDGSFVGGYWGYKAQVLEPWLVQNTNRTNKNIKIFGNSEWPTKYYCGFLEDEYVKNLFFSSKVCFNLHEPHSQVLGYDVIERPFKLLMANACVLSDRVAGLEELFPNEICYADSPSDYLEKFHILCNGDYQKYRNNSASVLRKHTYFDRAAQVFTSLGLHYMASQMLETKSNIIGEIK